MYCLRNKGLLCRHVFVSVNVTMCDNGCELFDPSDGSSLWSFCNVTVSVKLLENSCEQFSWIYSSEIQEEYIQNYILYIIFN